MNDDQLTDELNLPLLREALLHALRKQPLSDAERARIETFALQLYKGELTFSSIWITSRPEAIALIIASLLFLVKPEVTLNDEDQLMLECLVADCFNSNSTTRIISTT